MAQKYVDVEVRAACCCGICGVDNPVMFYAADVFWKRYVPSELQKEVLCRGCYECLRRLFLKGWRVVKEGP